MLTRRAVMVQPGLIGAALVFTGVPLFTPAAAAQSLPLSGSSSLAQLTAETQAGDSKAAVSLGKAYFYGQYGHRDLAQSAAFFTKARNAGNADGVAWLGGMFVTGQGLPKDVPSGVAMITDAAANGSAAGVRLKGMLLEQGIGQAANAQRAYFLYELAASHNDAEACDLIGLAYLHGQHRRQDLSKAANYFYKGSRLGSAAASLHLGEMFTGNRRFTDPETNQPAKNPDAVAASQYLSQASNLNNRIASYKLGELLLQDPSKGADGIQALWKAARHQYMPARLALGDAYAAGNIVKPDKPRAAALYAQAGDAGSAEGKKRAEAIKASLTQPEMQRYEELRANFMRNDQKFAVAKSTSD